MIARSRSLLVAAVLIVACNEPTGLFKSPPTDAAFGKGGGSGVTSALLPTLGGTSSVAYAVNDAGVVVGYSTDNTGTFFAVRWTRTGIAPWTITRIAGVDSRAFAVNANGAAVGVRAGQAKLWPAAGGEIDLGAGVPKGISSAETVVGVRSPIPESSQRAIVWTRPSTGWDEVGTNTFQDLAAFPGGIGETAAKAINDAGVIVGFVGVSTATTAYRAVRWDPVADHWGEPTALPATETSWATAGRAINENTDFGGHVRECFTPCSAVGIVWLSGGVGSSLAPFFGDDAGWVVGMNNARRMVGSRFDTRSGQRAFVWWPGQTSLLLLSGPRGNSATEAHDINNRVPAQAVGSGRGSNSTQAIVWTIPNE